MKKKSEIGLIEFKIKFKSKEDNFPLFRYESYNSKFTKEFIIENENIFREIENLIMSNDNTFVKNFRKSSRAFTNTDNYMSYSQIVNKELNPLIIKHSCGYIDYWRMYGSLICQYKSIINKRDRKIKSLENKYNKKLIKFV